MTGRRLRILLLLLCLWGVLPPARMAGGIEVTDSAGRHVMIPAEVHRVMPAGPPAALLLYAVAPEKLIGWPSALPPETHALLPPAYAGLPVIGRLTSKKPPTAEAIAQLHPDVILDIGDVEPDYAALADKIQRETGIPYLLFDGRLAHTPEILRRLGPLLGDAAAGERLADYAAGELKEIEAGLAPLPPAQRPGVYYARGATGLQTGPAGSLLGEIVEMAGGRNLAPPTGSSAPAKTTLAEIARWDPDVVITQDAGLYRAMPNAPGWKGLRAVEAHRIDLAPALPFGWIDEPPGINRLLGLRWLAATLHPEIFPWDERAAARQFCELFYHAKPSEAALDRILWPLALVTNSGTSGPGFP